MKKPLLIKYHLAIIVLACVLGGYLIEIILSSRHDDIQQTSLAYMDFRLSANDLQRMSDDVSQYLVAIDLILGADETYLLGGAIKKGELLARDIKLLSASELSNLGEGSLERIEKILLTMNEMLNASYQIGDANRSEVLNVMIGKVDELSSELIELILSLSIKVDDELRTRLKILNKKIELTSSIVMFLRVVYGLVILFVWCWSNKNISRPLRLLSEKAKELSSSDSAKLVISGPWEIQELSKHLQKMASELLHQARHDALTNLYNRREFARQLSEKFSIVCDPSRKYLLCFIDLDRFKIVNDSCGHAAGDQLLILVAKTIQCHAGEGAIVARLGGDEFAVCWEEESNGKVKADQIANDILRNIRAIKFEWEGSVYRISASIGMTHIAGCNTDIADWLNAADSACLSAKEMGRDKIQHFEVNDSRLNNKRGETKVYHQILHALENDRFVLYRQDIVPLQGEKGMPNYFEILIRMLGEDDEIIPPGKFLDVVERYQIAERLDKWVLTHVISWLEAHSQDGAPFEMCSINLSGQSLASDNMRVFMMEAIRSMNISAERLCFEITETSAINDMNEAQVLIEEVGALGCKFALDDFGAGVSSFGYLQQLRVDCIKIDGSFVRDVLSNPFNEAMVKCINDIGKAANMKTVAEFVENKDIAERLMAMGVDYAQGYYYSVPRPLDAPSLNKH